MTTEEKKTFVLLSSPAKRTTGKAGWRNVCHEEKERAVTVGVDKLPVQGRYEENFARDTDLDKKLFAWQIE